MGQERRVGALRGYGTLPSCICAIMRFYARHPHPCPHPSCQKVLAMGHGGVLQVFVGAKRSFDRGLARFADDLRGPGPVPARQRRRAFLPATGRRPLLLLPPLNLPRCGRRRRVGVARRLWDRLQRACPDRAVSWRKGVLERLAGRTSPFAGAQTIHSPVGLPSIGRPPSSSAGSGRSLIGKHQVPSMGCMRME